MKYGLAVCMLTAFSVVASDQTQQLGICGPNWSRLIPHELQLRRGFDTTEHQHLAQLADKTNDHLWAQLDELPSAEVFRLTTRMLNLVDAYLNDTPEMTRENLDDYGIYNSDYNRIRRTAKSMVGYLLGKLTPEKRRQILESDELLIQPKALPNRADYVRQNIDDAIDAAVGIDYLFTEGGISQNLTSHLGTADWSAGDMKSSELLTSYFDFDPILEMADLKPGQQVADLGCAYGRMGFFIGARRRDVRFVGYEINPVRVQVADSIRSNLGYSNVEFVREDLSSDHFVLPNADVFFLYDPVNEETRSALLQKLKLFAQRRQAEHRPPLKILVRQGRSDSLHWWDRQTFFQPVPGKEFMGTNQKITKMYQSP